MPVVVLEDRALIEVAGPDAEHFLQNVLTTDLDTLPEGIARPGALLSPQGKILFDYLIFRQGNDRVLLDCRADIIPDFIKRLTLYRLRAKASIQARNQPVTVFWQEKDSGTSDSESNSSQADSASVVDSRFVSVEVKRFYGSEKSASGPLSAWTKLRVENGIAESGSDYELGDAFPHDVLFDQMQGVGFQKGCYIGQEVVSRMQHRGTARRRVLIAEGDAPLSSGAEIKAGGKAVGIISSAVGNAALAIARIDRVKSAMDKGLPLSANEIVLRLSIPAWARFTFPQDLAEGS